MSVLIVGSTALDSIKTPKAENPRLLGGSASHAAVAASLFAPVIIVGVVGDVRHRGLDAPVTGSKLGAEAGTLTFMAYGLVDDHARPPNVNDLFQTLTRESA